MSTTPTSAPDTVTKPERRRASRAAGPASSSAEAATVTTPVDRPVEPKPSTRASVAPPPRRRPNRRVLGVISAAVLVVLVGALAGLGGVMLAQKRSADATAARDQQFVDTASQTVVNMFSYTPDTIDTSVNRFMDGISGPLRDMMSQNNNVENLKAIFRDTNSTSEAVINGAALEGFDDSGDRGSVLVAVRVTVTDIDGVNKPSQAYRLRVIVNEDDNGRMTGYDLKYPDGGN